ncbi:MAG: hypothetical protein AABY27_02490 [Pseudomonadota bacterium]
MGTDEKFARKEMQLKSFCELLRNVANDSSISKDIDKIASTLHKHKVSDKEDTKFQEKIMPQKHKDHIHEH